MTSLAELAIGDKAIVEAIEGTDVISLRLLEMGVTPGIEIEMIGKATLGDPLEFSIRGYRLSLRKAEARRVTVASSI